MHDSSARDFDDIDADPEDRRDDRALTGAHAIGARATMALSALVVSESGVACVALPATGEIRIGRGAACDLRVADPSVAELHATLRVDEVAGADTASFEIALAVLAHESEGGTRVRGERIAAGVVVPVAVGEVFMVGAVAVLVQSFAPVRAGDDDETAEPPQRPSYIRLVELLEQSARSPSSRPAAPSGFVVHRDAMWFRASTGQVVSLRRRHVLRRVIAVLLAEHARAPGMTVSLEQIVRAGWPGEPVAPRAAKNRVHVALTTLRILGLRDVIVSRKDGYAIDPALDVVVDERDDA